MTRLTTWALFVAIAGALAAGCSAAEPASPDEHVDVPGGEAPEAPRPAPVFLAPSAYEDLVTLDPTFPFGVTRRHAADDGILGSRWGRHGGPMVTTGSYGAGDASAPVVVQWTVGQGATDRATSTERPIGVARGLPPRFFYGPDGMVDLPFGPLSLLSYTGAGGPFPGEALLYSASYDAVVSRAHVNGFFSGVGVAVEGASLLVYSGLSPLTSSASSTEDNGLYAAPVCGDALASGAPCAAPCKLLGWGGMSGPVATDLHGNVFVGASLSRGATSDAVYALAKGQLMERAARAATLAEVDSGGTSSLAAVAPEEDAPGWVVGLGYETPTRAYAAAFTEADGGLSRAGDVVPAAIVAARGASGLSVFTSGEGDLWLAVTKGEGGAYLELRRRP